MRGISRVYRMGDTELRALDGVDVTIERGESVAIMGTSGSGKSTLMNIMGCLDTPTSGTYSLLGQDVAKMTRTELAQVRGARLGFVFQSFNLLSRTTALDNVALPLIYQGASARERRERAAAALATVGLAERTHHVPSELSGGQQQRVAIARALVTKPEIIMADEPTGALDSKTSADVMALLQSLVDGGFTLILVTHEADIAAYAGRVIVLRDGKIIEDRRQTPVRAVSHAGGVAA
ncbi:MAG: ABC transporter ATP-binding protein [Myxococcales bacterium]|nr:ABC transporter ATP-binding protein [Myxococcales bacterium]